LQFAIAGEEQEKVADQETLILLKRFSLNPGGTIGDHRASKGCSQVMLN
jgi:hypothetical protein